ncbi:hypothetical protein [Guggenheimella bovis]
MINRSICIGTYNDLEIFYNKETKSLETSGVSERSFNQSLLLGLILVATPGLKIIHSMMPETGIKVRILLLLLSAVIGVFSGLLVNRNVNRKIKLTPFTLNKYQFEVFYQENEKRLKALKWVNIGLILPLFIEILIFISFGLFIAAFIFPLNVFAVTLLFISGAPYRRKTFEEIRRSYE